MKRINVAVIGTGWCGGIRAAASATSPWVNQLHIAEIREERLKEVAAATNPATATTDYRTLLSDSSIDAVMISSTPEPTHFPIAKESMLAGKHVFLEKPIALELAEADELIALAKQKNLLFTIGYSQRFNPKFAYVKRSIKTARSASRSARWTEPPHYAKSRQKDRRAGKAVSGGHGSDARYRFRGCGASHHGNRSAFTPRK